MISLLFTSVGRRVELLQAFRKAALDLNMELIIYGADISENAPALKWCDHFVKVPKIIDPSYIDTLIEVCKENHIDMLIPTIDTDLLKLSYSKGRFESFGTKVLISSPSMIEKCRDKNLIYHFFVDCGLKAPMTYHSVGDYIDKYPAFIKPKDGSSSVNAFKVRNKDELLLYSSFINDYIIQPFIDGKEYTVDVMCDLVGNPISIVPRERLSTRSGEVLQTMIELDKKIIDESIMICCKFKPAGPITIQLIRDKNDDDYFIEINPRFGGGAPLSMKAGSESAHDILRIVCGEQINYMDKMINNFAYYSRFDQSICVNQPISKIKGIIFDLDDTLYNEIDYVKSGFKAISRYLQNDLYYDRLLNLFNEGKPPIDILLDEIGRSFEKDAVLDVYRKHYPIISLNNETITVLQSLREYGIKIGIITDGRVEGQNNKINALKLSNYVDEIVVTDSIGGIEYRKPCDISYRMIQYKWKIPFENIAYVGDNITKDFIAPKNLGMISVYYKNSQGLYYQGNTNYNYIHSINSLKDLLDFIKEK